MGSSYSGLNILYLIQYFGSPDDSWVAGRSFEFVRYWARKGVSVTVVCSDAYINDPKKVKSWFDEGITLRIIHQPYRNEMSAVRRAFAFMAFYLKALLVCIQNPKFDLIYASSTPLSVGLLGAHLASLFRIPLYFEVRDLWPDFPIQMGAVTSKTLKKLLYKIENYIYQQAEKIISLSPTASKTLVEQKGVKNARIITMPNGTTFPYFKPTRTKRQLIQTTSPALITYAGSFGKANNISWLMDFCEVLLNSGKSSKVRIRLIGSGSERPGVLRWYKKLTARQKNIIAILPVMPRREVANWLIASDFSIITFLPIPSLAATSPNKFFDALSTGSIPVTNHRGWVGELIAEESLGIVSESPLEAAREVLQLCAGNEPNTMRQMQKRCLKTAKYYRRDSMAQQLLNEFVQYYK